MSLLLSHWYPGSDVGQNRCLIVSIPDLCPLSYFRRRNTIPMQNSSGGGGGGETNNLGQNYTPIHLAGINTILGTV